MKTTSNKLKRACREPKVSCSDKKELWIIRKNMSNIFGRTGQDFRAQTSWTTSYLLDQVTTTQLWTHKTQPDKSKGAFSSKLMRGVRRHPVGSITANDAVSSITAGSVNSLTAGSVSSGWVFIHSGYSIILCGYFRRRCWVEVKIWQGQLLKAPNRPLGRWLAIIHKKNRRIISPEVSPEKKKGIEIEKLIGNFTRIGILKILGSV